jgi:hypothetical protein
MAEKLSGETKKNQEDAASYHLQRIIVGKFYVARLAVMLEMSLAFHVLIRCTRGVEFGVACFAWYLGREMPTGGHVLVYGVLRAKFPGAGLAFEDRCPVVLLVHMLLTSPESPKGTQACVALVAIRGARRRVV